MDRNTRTTIVGAGPVGLSLALMRAASGANVTLIDKVEMTVAGQDSRSLAVSYGSMQVLKRLGLDITHVAHAPIKHIHISEHNAWGHTQLHHDDLDAPMLGAVVRYGELVAQLTRLVTSQDKITMIRPTSITELTESEQHCQLTLSNGQILQSDLLVHAEGGLFQNNDLAQHDYKQTALIANVTFATAKPAWAWERFTAEGPCALLPASNDGLTFNLVWCMERARAAELQNASDVDFIAQLNQAVRHLTGRINHVSLRIAFPLGLKRPPELHSKTRIAIGNAAQTLHPVAGQGFNLGLRDAFVLNQSLNEQPTLAQALNAFIHQRQQDRSATVRITDALARGFFSDFGIGHLRSAGFALLNAFPVLKSQIARQFMFGTRS